MQQEPTIPQMPSSYTPPIAPLPEPDVQKQKAKGEGWRSIISTILIVVSAPIIALVLINFVFQSYEVEGPSMETTLQNKDRLIVWKIPRTIARIQKKSYIPARGDIIIFIKHGLYNDGRGGDKQLIKRVIGLPGDRVVITDGDLVVYNAEHPDGFNPDNESDYGDVIKKDIKNVDVTVGDDEVFVCGDNRTHSQDSRAFGSVPASDIIGKLEFRIFPFDQVRKF